MRPDLRYGVLGLMLSLPFPGLPSKGVPQQSTSAVGAPNVFNFVSKNFGDVNARGEPLFHSPSGHIQECRSIVLKPFLLKSAV